MCVVNGVHELLFPTSAMRCVEALKCFNIQASMNNFKTFHVSTVKNCTATRWIS